MFRITNDGLVELHTNFDFRNGNRTRIHDEILDSVIYETIEVHVQKGQGVHHAARDVQKQDECRLKGTIEIQSWEEIKAKGLYGAA